MINQVYKNILDQMHEELKKFSAASGFYEDAERITLVMYNLNTHKPGAPYDTYKPERAKQF